MYSEETGSFVGVGISALAAMLSAACQQNTETCKRKAIIVSGNRFEEYLTLLQNQHVVESQLLECLPDCLNAEVRSWTFNQFKLELICSYFGFVICDRIKNFQKWYFFAENTAKSVDEFYLFLQSCAVIFKLSDPITVNTKSMREMWKKRETMEFYLCLVKFIVDPIQHSAHSCQHSRFYHIWVVPSGITGQEVFQILHSSWLSLSSPF